MKEIIGFDKSEDFLNLIWNSISDGLVLSDKDGIVKKVNENYCQIYGFEEDELIGEKFSIIFDEKQREQALAAYKEVFDDGKNQAEYQVEVKTKNGDIKFVASKIVFIELESQEKLMLSIVKDLTHEKRIEKEKDELALERKNILESISDGFFTLNNNLQVDFFNKAAEELLGKKDTEVVGKNLFEVFPEAKGSIFEENYSIALAQRKAQSFEVYFPPHQEWYRVNAYPYGKNKLSVFFQIITAQKQYEETLQVQKEEIMSQNEELRVQNDELTKTTKKLSESEDRFRGIFENANVGIVLANIEGYIIEANPEFQIYLGYNLRELKNMHFKYITHPDDIDEEMEYYKKLINGERSTYRFEKRYITKNNQIVWGDINISSRYDKYGELYQFIGMVIDITDSKLSKTKLEQSEKRYQILSDSTFEAIFISENGICTNQNKSAEKLFGYSLQEAIGKHGVEWIVPEQRELVFQQMSKLSSTPYEVKALRKNGSTFPAEIQSKTIIEGDKNYRITALRDITSRKEAENKLKERNHFIQTVMDNLPIGIALNKFEEGEAVYINDKFEEIYGWSREILKDINTFFKCVYPDPNYRKEITDRILSDIQSGDPSRMAWKNIKIHTSDGEIKYINAVNIPLIEQNIMISTVMDVTREQIALLSLKESEQKYKHIIENIDEVIYVVDELGTITFVSGNIENFSGKGIDFFLGEKIEKLIMSFNFDEDQIKEFQTIFRNAIVNKKSKLIHEYEVEFNGEKKYFENIDQLVYDNEGLYKGNIGIAREITARKNYEKELLEAKEKAEESDRLKSAFLANMSHEIRTPMNGILGFAELLNDENLTNEDSNEYIQIIKNSGHRMLSIINDLIDISKIESGQMDIHYTNVLVNDLMKDQYYFFKTEARIRKLQLEMSTSSEEQIIYTDKAKLEQVLSNLIKNAIKYSVKGKIEFGYVILQNRIRFFVKDEGIGISEENLELIFDRFSQAKREIPEIEGAGLGLAISKSYVEMLGGRIWVESKYGIGSTFYFELPIKNTSLEVTSYDEKEDIDNNYIEQNHKILICEDIDTSFLLLEKFLKKRTNLELFRAKNGIEAIAIVKENPDIQLILMDIRMPKMDGYEAHREIRKINNKVIIIAQSAFALSSDHIKMKEEGFDDYLSKPIDRSLLLEMIDKYLR